MKTLPNYENEISETHLRKGSKGGFVTCENFQYDLEAGQTMYLLPSPVGCIGVDHKQIFRSLNFEI